MRFDAYAGNVSGLHPEEVGTVLAASLGCRLERGRPKPRHGDVFEVKDGAELVGWLGHDRALHAAYFEFKGEQTPAAASCIRRHWAHDHSVSRVDSCEDYEEAGAFERLLAVFDAAKDPRVKSLEMRPREGDRGRTVYFGSQSSRLMCRLYEAGKMKERLRYGRPNWVRGEAQLRPGKAIEKRAAAQASPVEVWGFAAWSLRAAEVLTQIEVPRFAPPSSVPTFDRTTAYVARAFRKHWAVMLEDFGAWDCIGRELEAVWRADDEAAASLAHAKGSGDGSAA